MDFKSKSVVRVLTITCGTIKLPFRGRGFRYNVAIGSNNLGSLAVTPCIGTH
jgi:hypothetical protein